MASALRVVLMLFCVFCTLKSVNSIYCYQCSGTDSNNPFECNEFLPSDVDLQAIDCANIHDAQYCIKQVGRTEGGITTTRYCSSLDIGNYCNYVHQPGDRLEYRTCIYTCTSDGCNSATSLAIPAATILLTILLKIAL